MRVLVACEESQRVCTAFRERGHEAYSCDIQECSGGRPEWHIQGDCLSLLNGGVHICNDGRSRALYPRVGFAHSTPSLYIPIERRSCEVVSKRRTKQGQVLKRLTG